MPILEPYQIRRLASTSFAFSTAAFSTGSRHIKLIFGHMGEMLSFQLDRVIDIGETKKDLAREAA